MDWFLKYIYISRNRYGTTNITCCILECKLSTDKLNLIIFMFNRNIVGLKVNESDARRVRSDGNKGSHLKRLENVT